MSNEADIEQAVLAAAKSDAEFDGRPWMSMPKTERERYVARARRAVAASFEVLTRPLQRLVGPSYECPCDCYECDCGDINNAEAVAYWNALENSRLAVGRFSQVVKQVCVAG
jgi:hypothetical protein